LGISANVNNIFGIFITQSFTNSKKGQTDGLFGTISQATLQAEKASLFSLQNRHEEYLKLGNQIEEVAQLFKEIAVLVESQSEIVDSIEQNVLKAEDQIKDGTKQLGQAEENKKSSRKKKVVCFSIIAVVIIIIVSVLIISV
jgi:syntaxin 1B/2/3